MVEFTHLAGDRVRMVDITEKADSHRSATATGTIFLSAETLRAIAEKTTRKGNVLATAEVAAILAVKKTATIIPMCHPIPVGGVTVSFSENTDSIGATVTVKTYGRTGVEMEALTGVSVALLTIWDMVKSAEKDEDGQYPATRIEGISVVRKEKSLAEPSSFKSAGDE
ncbi:MAG: cyclic pyranopterin monophosphate synthase MoaC [Methanocalculus sp. MSAO_Arc1]|uniref:cyclic pyranopterin monophosphate synthase MoaC n=1 Tax=Methanocalculus TaxID=71151 RepID=UPI000FF84D6B|nr:MULTISPECIES: cyclic pyranopterin monophosphate synthase MoaC [unclassified Methanocalculus]MCP1663117.1 cyclic pyranopterin phosphate synthase [Methanocalculus sp. AMF5]RQD81580.1 MAG: cyclic pyranopterin monophosphate synthase MoaC [Methanocalculus sp. MSAO_Arc1]